MIWFLGDPHGRFDHVISLVKLHKPESIVFLGDLESSIPLEMMLRPIMGMDGDSVSIPTGRSH